MKTLILLLLAIPSVIYAATLPTRSAPQICADYYQLTTHLLDHGEALIGSRPGPQGITIEDWASPQTYSVVAHANGRGCIIRQGNIQVRPRLTLVP